MGVGGALKGSNRAPDGRARLGERAGAGRRCQPRHTPPQGCQAGGDFFAGLRGRTLRVGELLCGAQVAELEGDCFPHGLSRAATRRQDCIEVGRGEAQQALSRSGSPEAGVRS